MFDEYDLRKYLIVRQFLCTVIECLNSNTLKETANFIIYLPFLYLKCFVTPFNFQWLVAFAKSSLRKNFLSILSRTFVIPEFKNNLKLSISIEMLIGSHLQRSEYDQRGLLPDVQVPHFDRTIAQSQQVKVNCGLQAIEKRCDQRGTHTRLLPIYFEKKEYSRKQRVTIKKHLTVETIV